MRVIAAVAGVVGLIVCIAGAVAGVPGTIAVVGEPWPADGVTTVRVDAVDAVIAVRAVADEAIRAALADGSPLAATRSGATLSLRVPDEGTVRTLALELPARLALDLHYRNGRVTVAGLRGGVRAAGNSGLRGSRGAMTVDVPQGPLDLDLKVGRIDARVAAAIDGAVDVRSTVGDARVTIDGRRLITPREPGPGHRLSLDGAGPAPLRLRVQVGTAELRVGGSDRQ